jgi:hypothetical protein
VRAANAGAPPRVGEKIGVHPGSVEVVNLDGNAREQLVDEPSTSWTTPPIRVLYTDEQLRGGDCRHCDVIVVLHDVLNRSSRALLGEQDGRVEDQPFQ